MIEGVTPASSERYVVLRLLNFSTLLSAATQGYIPIDSSESVFPNRIRDW